MYDCTLGIADAHSDYCASSCFAPNDCESRIYEAIEKSIARMSDPTQEYFDTIDELLSKETILKMGAARVQKIGDSLYFDGGGLSFRFLSHLRVISEHIGEFRDFDAVFMTNDDISFSSNKVSNDFLYSGPILVVNYKKHYSQYEIANHNNLVLIPDYYVLKSHSYANKIKTLNKLANKLDFDTAVDEAMFRGMGSGKVINGPRGSIASINDNPRLKLPLLNFLFDDYLDVGLNQHTPGVNPSDLKVAQLEKIYDDLMGNKSQNFLPIEEQAKYKYILSLDGFASSWSRPQIICFTQSLLLYQTEYVQWFQPALLSGVHYRPVNYDLGNLLEQINWAREHTSEVKEIIKNQNEVAHNCFTPAKAEEQLVHTLKIYAERFQYNITNRGFPVYKE